MIFNAASSCWSSLPIQEAIQNIVVGKTYEPLLGVISAEHIQICPQHAHYFDTQTAEELLEKFPKVQFRLHADVRLKNKRGVSIDLSDYSKDTSWYFKELAQLSKKLGSKFYSLHAGKRKVNLEQLKEQYLRVQDIFNDVIVCVEGLYPASQGKWIIDSWSEYAWLAENSIPYAIDLSHLKIVEKKLGLNDDLIKDLIKNPLCEEIHISFNDGNLDSHNIAQNEYSNEFDRYKTFLKAKQEKSVIFTEGNQVLYQKRQQRLNN